MYKESVSGLSLGLDSLTENVNESVIVVGSSRARL